MNNISERDQISKIYSSRIPSVSFELLNKLPIQTLSSANSCIQAAQVAIEISALNIALKLSLKAVELEPHNQMLRTSLITAYMFIKDNQGALDCCFSFIKQFGDNGIVQNLIGHAYSGLGKFKQAEKAFRLSLKLEPNQTNAITGLSRSKKFESLDALETINLFKKTLETSQRVDAKSTVEYSIAKLLNDISDYDAAWQSATQANHLLVNQYPFNQKKSFATNIDQTINHYKTSKKVGHSKAEHLLIVGMPRSGTTLMEQIIGGHPDFHPGGELPAIDYALAYGAYGKNALSALSVDELTQCSYFYEAYFKELEPRIKPGISLINKLPINFMNIGIFKSMFPNGKIIHIKRDYRDVVASTYFEQFAPQMNYTTKVENIIFMYKECMRIMKQWHLIYDDIFEISYESLTSDTENEMVRIAEYLGKNIQDFDDFTKTKNSVETLSLWQVRQGMYTSSINRYQRYQPLMGLPKNIEHS